MSSKFEHCPLNDCTSMVNNADNIMSSGYAKSAKAKSLPSAFFRKKNTNSTFTRENCKKNTKADELQQHEKVLCNLSVTSMATPKRKINREMESACKVEEKLHVMHNSEECQSKSEESIKEERLEKSQSSHAQELINHHVSDAKLLTLNSNEQHGNHEENVSNCCNGLMHDKQSSPKAEEQIYKQKMRQVDDMQSSTYGDNASHYYNDNTNNSIIDSNDAINVNATNKFAGAPDYLNSRNECLKTSNNNKILSPCDNKCQQYECLHPQQGQYEHNEEEVDTDHIINEKVETTATTISEEENDTSDLLSSTPTPAHRNSFARYTRPLVQLLQRITEMPCHDGCHNPYSPSLLLDECACMAESSFYSCYSDSAETQRETDSCSSPDRWHHRCGDYTPTTSSQNITPTTTRAATVSTLPRCSLSEQSERGNNECMGKNAHYLLMHAPQSPQHVLTALPHTTNYYTPSFSSRQSMTETQYDNENEMCEHNNFRHNIDNKNGSTAMTDGPFEQCQGKHENCTLDVTNKDEKLTKQQIEQEGTGANMFEQERGCAKRYDTTENNGQLLEPQMSIWENTCYSSADLFTPYRGIYERPSWEPLHEENLSMTHNGVSRRLMWPSPLSPLSPSPSPTKASLPAITTHYTQLKEPFSSSQQRSNFNSLNNISGSINDTVTNTSASNTSPMTTTATTSSTSISPTTAMMMLKSMPRSSVTLHETVRSSHSHQPTTRVVKTIVQCGVDRSSGRPIPLRREGR